MYVFSAFFPSHNTFIFELINKMYRLLVTASNCISENNILIAVTNKSVGVDLISMIESVSHKNQSMCSLV